MRVQRIRGLVAAGQADSVSGFVQHVVAVSLDDVAGWGVMLAQTGGDPTADERAWAGSVLDAAETRLEATAA